MSPLVNQQTPFGLPQELPEVTVGLLNMFKLLPLLMRDFHNLEPMCVLVWGAQVLHHSPFLHGRCHMSVDRRKCLAAKLYCKGFDRNGFLSPCCLVNHLFFLVVCTTEFRVVCFCLTSRHGHHEMCLAGHCRRFRYDLHHSG